MEFRARKDETDEVPVNDLNDLQKTIEERIATFDLNVELIALEQPAAETLRLYIDHPDGVECLSPRIRGVVNSSVRSLASQRPRSRIIGWPW